jgi:hypothetical protein
MGGSKDYLDIPNWRHKDGSVPDKNDITNAYAAAYNHDGDTIIYFGMDRFATQGSANVGFWFLQDPNFGIVAGDPAGSTSGFTGEHKTGFLDGDNKVPGDLLVLSEFDEGGDNPSIKVFEWVGSGGDEGNGSLKAILDGSTGTPAECGAASHPDEVCAIVNEAPVDPEWLYEGKKVKGNESTEIPTAAFFEGGLNLTEMFGVTPCVSSFVAETRSSFETNAILKDLVVGDFDLCGSLGWSKVDGDGAALGGATFGVCRVNGEPDHSTENDEDPEDGPCWKVKDNANDPDTSQGSGEPSPATPLEPEDDEKSDEDDVVGELVLSGLQPGDYTIEETVPPDGYLLDDRVRVVTVVQGMVVSRPTVPDGDDADELLDEDPFVNVGAYKIIVLTCQQDTLVDSTVALDDDSTTGDQKATLVDGDEDAPDLNDLCDLEDGAVYDGLVAGDYDLEVELPDVAPLFPVVEE